MSEVVDKVGTSVRLKQVKLYEICHSYLIDNFHKFSESNKIKVSLAITGKMVPTTQKLEGEISFNKTPDVIIGDKPVEYNIGSRIVEHTQKARDPS